MKILVGVALAVVLFGCFIVLLVRRSKAIKYATEREGVGATQITEVGRSAIPDWKTEREAGPGTSTWKKQDELFSIERKLSLMGYSHQEIDLIVRKAKSRLSGNGLRLDSKTKKSLGEIRERYSQGSEVNLTDLAILYAALGGFQPSNESAHCESDTDRPDSFGPSSSDDSPSYGSDDSSSGSSGGFDSGGGSSGD